MPRHPPCALHSLSHTPPTQPHPTNPQPAQARTAHTRRTQPGGIRQAMHTTHYKDARVHYPDLKQQPHTPRPDPQRAGHEAGWVVPKPQTPPPRVRGWVSDSSEPQQCVVDVPHLQQAPAATTQTTRTVCARVVMDRCVCSLERR